MTITELIIYLQNLQSEGKGEYKVLAHNVDLNTANGGEYKVNEKEDLNSYNITVDEKDEVLILGDYMEYYSY